jgi:hypothetical protein
MVGPPSAKYRPVPGKEGTDRKDIVGISSIQLVRYSDFLSLVAARDALILCPQPQAALASKLNYPVASIAAFSFWRDLPRSAFEARPFSAFCPLFGPWSRCPWSSSFLVFALRAWPFASSHPEKLTL